MRCQIDQRCRDVGVVVVERSWLGQGRFGGDDESIQTARARCERLGKGRLFGNLIKCKHDMFDLLPHAWLEPWALPNHGETQAHCVTQPWGSRCSAPKTMPPPAVFASLSCLSCLSPPHHVHSIVDISPLHPASWDQLGPGKSTVEGARMFLLNVPGQG